MRVLVCGGRDYRDRFMVCVTLDNLVDERGEISAIIHGGATGADEWAHEWAVGSRCDVEVYPAEWDLLGRRAGPRRNALMLSRGRPDLVVAFHGGRGTADMVRRARAAGVEVVEVPR